MRRAAHVGLGLASLALALGCGGGGGGGDDRTEISVENAQDLAGQVLLGMFWTSALGDFGEDVGGSAQAEAAGGGISLQAVIGPITEPCPEGGTQTVSANIANPPPLSVGDTLSASFAECELETGETANGVLSFVVRALAGDLDGELFAFNLALTLDALEVAQGAETQLFDGGATLIVDTRDPPFSKSVVSGNALAILGEGPGLGDGVELLLEAFTTNSEIDIVNEEGDSTLAGSGNVAGVLIDGADETPIGQVSYASETPFEMIGSADPSEGELLITGAGDATIRVIAGGAVATLQIDLDGDGVVDATQTPAWAELLSFE